MYAAALALSAAISFQEPPAESMTSPVVDPAWIERVETMLVPGTAFRLISDSPDQKPLRGLAVFVYSSEEAAAIRREGAVMRKQLEEIEERAFSESRERGGALRVDSEEYMKASLAVSKAEGMHDVLACGDGQLSYRDRHVERIRFRPDDGTPVVRHVTLSAIQQVTETAARYAERTGTPLPEEPASEPPVTPSDDDAE